MKATSITVKVKDWNGTRTEELAFGTAYQCSLRMTIGYGIIVIDDILKVAPGTLGGNYLDAALTIGYEGPSLSLITAAGEKKLDATTIGLRVMEDGSVKTGLKVQVVIPS